MNFGFDVVQMVVQGGSAAVLLLLGWKALDLFRELMTNHLHDFRNEMREGFNDVTDAIKALRRDDV